MSQAWLQVIGLIVEFAGVLLLALEWFAAQRQDAAERLLEVDHQRREAGMVQLQRLQQSNPSVQRHYEMTLDAQRRMTDTRVDLNRQRYGGLRKRTVMLALLFVGAGFLLQLLGSWPGCCAAIGIVSGA